MVEHGTLRIGVLGAAKISGSALYAPVADTADVVVVAIAARDRSRAEAHAEAHGIARVHDTYEQVLADPEVDAIYNPLPINLHHQWTIAALRAGKHVLCEKPFASNADEAAEMVAVGRETGLVLMEAFHWRFHPLADRMAEHIAGLGPIEHIDATFSVPIPDADDVRQSWELSGGALMDLGCYPVQWVRFAGGSEPTVVSASMTEGRPNVDVVTDVDVEFADGATGHIHTAMAVDAVAATLEVRAGGGTLRVDNPIAPHHGHLLSVTTANGTTTETLTERSTYHFQLDAFVDAVVNGAPFPTGGSDSINTMALIDAAYLAAGLPRRGTTPS